MGKEIERLRATIDQHELSVQAIEWENERLREANERLHAQVSDLTARLDKAANLHRRSILPDAHDHGGRENVSGRAIATAKVYHKTDDFNYFKALEE